MRNHICTRQQFSTKLVQDSWCHEPQTAELTLALRECGVLSSWHSDPRRFSWACAMPAQSSIRVDINRPGASASRAGPSSTDVHTFFGLEGPLAVLLSALHVIPHPPGATEVTRCAPTSGLPQQLIPRAAGWGEAARRADARHAPASDDRGGRRSAAHMSSAAVASTVRPRLPTRHACCAAAQQ